MYVEIPEESEQLKLAVTVLKDSNAFYARLSTKMEKRYRQDSTELQREYVRLAERNQGIDGMFLNLYSDKAKGIITEQRFVKLTEGLEAEQKENDIRMQGLMKYHKRIPKYYNRAHGIMSDEDLNIAIYGHEIAEVA